jgi:hypothetical protein
LRSLARTILTFVNRVGPLTPTSRQLSAFRKPIDSGGHVVAQFLRSLQRSFNPDNLHLAGRDLPGRFAVASRSQQAALVAGKHTPKERHRTFLRLRMRTAEADQSLRAMLPGGQSAEVSAHLLIANPRHLPARGGSGSYQGMLPGKVPSGTISKSELHHGLFSIVPLKRQASYQSTPALRTRTLSQAGRCGARLLGSCSPVG